MNRAKIAISGFAAGAALMYLMDPDRGRRRRVLARDKAIGNWNNFSALLDKAKRDIVHRAEGAACEVKSVFQDHSCDDDVLVQRVRSRIGRVVSHPHAINVSCRNGDVTLEGPILQYEVDHMLQAVKSVPGVKGIENKLEIHAEASNVSSLQGGIRHESRSELMQECWTPALRVAAGGLGTALMGYAMGSRNGGMIKKAGGLAGVALTLRAISNRELRDVVGAGDGARAVVFDKTIHIQAPIEDVFALWSDYEKFPRFMTHIREVRDLGNGKSHWIAEGPGGIQVSWDAEITERIANKLLAWRSVPGSTVETEGTVRFDSTENQGTRVTVRLCYKPPAGVIGHSVASLFRADAKHEMDDDLVRLKSLIEMGKTRAHGAKVTREDLNVPRAV